MIPANLSPLGNHLWQSTLCAGVAWLLTLALRRNRAAVRYWIWLAASVKFLIPFSLLVSAGGQLGWRTAPTAMQPQVSIVMDEIGRPFGPAMDAPTPAVAPPASAPVPGILFAVWLCGFTISALVCLRFWLRVRALRRMATPLRLGLPIPVLSSPAPLEPGVFGMWKPVLLLPKGIAERLTAAELHAILGHEVCHARRRDNLTAAIHMVVEIIFWFHPLVWWIRTRLVAERELACDEEVLRVADPAVYAEGILSVCKFYLESPLACVSGVTGADLKKRIAIIMARPITHDLNFPRKLLLAVAGVAAVTAPIAIGLLNAPASQAQAQSPAAAQAISYVASVKPNNAVDARTFSEYLPGGRLTATAVTVAQLLRIAYRIQPYQLVGAPAWISTGRYDIEAKVEDHPAPSQQALLRMLLKDRFKLMAHNETRELPIFALVLAKSDGKLGPQLIQSAFDCAAYLAGPHPPPEPGRAPNCGARIGLGALSAKAIPMTQLATNLAPFVHRFTVDKTGLTGGFDVELTWTPDQAPSNVAGDALPEVAPSSSGPSIFAALQEQLGLKLVSERGPVDVLVVDHLEEPSEN